LKIFQQEEFVMQENKKYLDSIGVSLLANSESNLLNINLTPGKGLKRIFYLRQNLSSLTLFP
jgi:hypothetical protein